MRGRLSKLPKDILIEIIEKQNLEKHLKFTKIEDNSDMSSFQV
jgi:hypothetical protein